MQNNGLRSLLVPVYSATDDQGIDGGEPMFAIRL